MGTLFESIQYVTGAFTLVAFAIAAVLAYLLMRTRASLAIYKSSSEAGKELMIRSEFPQLRGLTAPQTERELERRHRRFLYALLSCVALGALFLILTLRSSVTNGDDETPKGPPTARINVRTEDSGLATLSIRFTNVPKNFRIQKVVFDVVPGAETALTKRPSDKVKAVRYSVKVPADLSEEESPKISVDLDLYRTKDEPYARADMVLWYEKPNMEISMTLTPIFYDENGERMTVNVVPTALNVTLRNSILVHATKGSPPMPAKGANDDKEKTGPTTP